MTKKILEMNSKQRITGSNRRTFLKGAGAPAASVVAAESTLASVGPASPACQPPRGLVVDMFKWLCQRGSLERGESIC